MIYKPIPGWGHAYEMAEDGIIYSKERWVARGNHYMFLKRKRRKVQCNDFYPLIKFVELYEKKDGVRRQQVVYIHKLREKLFGVDGRLAIMNWDRRTQLEGKLVDRLSVLNIGDIYKTDRPGERTGAYRVAKEIGIKVKTSVFDGIIKVKRIA